MFSIDEQLQGSEHVTLIQHTPAMHHHTGSKDIYHIRCEGDRSLTLDWCGRTKLNSTSTRHCIKERVYSMVPQGMVNVLQAGLDVYLMYYTKCWEELKILDVICPDICQMTDAYTVLSEFCQVNRMAIHSHIDRKSLHCAGYKHRGFVGVSIHEMSISDSSAHYIVKFYLEPGMKLYECT